MQCDVVHSVCVDRTERVNHITLHLFELKNLNACKIENEQKVHLLPYFCPDLGLLNIDLLL